MSEKKEKPVKMKKPGPNEVKFRVKMMKGFKAGQTLAVDKSRAEGWAKKGYGKIV